MHKGKTPTILGTIKGKKIGLYFFSQEPLMGLNSQLRVCWQ